MSIKFKKIKPQNPERTMKAHPAAELFPMMKKVELQELVDDIKENGLINPIIVHPNGGIIDGRNRFMACEKAGVEPKFRNWDGQGSLTALVISLNLHRRHLTIGQRAMIAAEAKPIFEKEAKKRQGTRTDLKANLPEGSKGQSRDHAAKAFDVSPRSVETASKVIQEGVDELIDAVKTGDISVSTAGKVSRAPKKTQKEFVDLTPSERKKELKKFAKQKWFSDESNEQFRKDFMWQYEFESGLIAIAGMPVNPAEYALNIRETMVGPVEQHIEAAQNWLSEFSKHWRLRHVKTIDGSATSVEETEPQGSLQPRRSGE